VAIVQLALVVVTGGRRIVGFFTVAAVVVGRVAGIVLWAPAVSVPTPAVGSGRVMAMAATIPKVALRLRPPATTRPTPEPDRTPVVGVLRTRELDRSVIVSTVLVLLVVIVTLFVFAALVVLAAVIVVVRAAVVM